MSTSASAASSSSSPPLTLSRLLLPNLPPTSVHPAAVLAGRILSTRTASFPLLSLSHTPLNLHLSIIRSGFCLPSCDLRLHPLTPSLRRFTFFAATKTFNCTYCVAHACTFGNLISGSVLSQWKQSQGGKQVKPLTMDQKGLTNTERVVKKITAMVCERKGGEQWQVVKGVLADLVTHIGETATEGVKRVLCVAAFLNSQMDVLGLEIEPEIRPFVTMVMGEQWDAGIHDTTEEGSRGMIQHKNVGFLELIRAICNSEMDAFRVFGVGYKGGAWEFEKGVKKAGREWEVCVGRAWMVFMEEGGKWGTLQRAVLMFVYGYLVRNRGMMKGGSRVSGIEESRLRDFVEGRENKGVWGESVDIGKSLIQISLEGAQNVVGPIVSKFLGVCGQEMVMEFVGLMGFFAFWNRVGRLYGEGEADL